MHIAMMGLGNLSFECTLLHALKPPRPSSPFFSMCVGLPTFNTKVMMKPSLIVFHHDER